MNNIYAYVKTIGSGSSEQNNSQDSANEPLRFILSTSEEIFPEFNLESISPVPYLPDTHLDDDNWFSIPNFSAQEYSIDIIGRKDQSNNFNFSTSDFEKLSNLNTDGLKYIFVQSQKHLFFQMVDLIVKKDGLLKISELIDYTGYSSRYINLLFETFLGCSAKQFCKNVKMHTIINELNRSDIDSFPNFSSKFDFYDQSHFVHSFKEFTGVAPKEYLNQVKKSSYKTKVIDFN